MSDQGVADITVYLVDLDFEIDSLNFNNKGAFIDSTTTDANGFFQFLGLDPGNYGVLIIPLRDKFILADDTDSDTFEIVNGESFTINFESEAPNVQGGGFEIIIRFSSENSVRDAQWVTVDRKEWAWFVPYWNEVDTYQTEDEDDWTEGRTFREKFPWGYTALAYTLSNEFLFQVADLSFKISFPLGSTPSSSEWQYDILSYELTRIN